MRPFTAIVDDAHWADPITLELLQFLLGTLGDAPVLVVVAYRTDELSESHPLHALIARASRARNVLRVELEPLGQAQIHELIDATLPKNVRLPLEAVRDVRDRSEGNPLYAEEYLKTAVDGMRSGDARTRLPASLRGLLLERVRRLAADDVRLLEIAALIGRRFAAAFLARVAGRDESALSDFLRAALDAHFLVEDADAPGWFRFRHALTRDTILSSVLAFQARALHVAIAQAIEREPDRDARAVELADHYWRAACFAECGGYAEQAGDLAKARHAYAQAAELYERAIACGVADQAGLVALHEKAAATYASLGGAQKVLEHLDVAVAHYTAAGDTTRLVELSLDLALALSAHRADRARVRGPSARGRAQQGKRERAAVAQERGAARTDARARGRSRTAASCLARRGAAARAGGAARRGAVLRRPCRTAPGGTRARRVAARLGARDRDRACARRSER